MHTILFIFLIAQALAALAVVYAVRQGRRGRNTTASNDNARIKVTHHGTLTRTVDSDVSTRYLLVTQGADPLSVDIAGVADVPIGVALDTALQDEFCSIGLLGSSEQTRLAIAAGAIDAGVRIFAAANGKVSALSASAGTYQCVGVALEAAALDGDTLEFDPCTAFPVTVS